MPVFQYKLVAAVRVPDPSAIYVNEKNGGGIPKITINLVPGLWYVLGDGSANDLLQMIMNVATVADSELSELLFSLAAVPGVGTVVRHKMQGIILNSIKLHWIDPDLSGPDALQTQADLRLESHGTSYTLAGLNKDGDMTHLGGFYPVWYLVEDLEEDEFNGSQFVPDVGNPTTLLVAMRGLHRLRLRTEGRPRDSGQNEYQDLKRWWRHAAAGFPFRLYADADATDPYDSTDRRGYQSAMLTEESSHRRPQPDDPEFYTYFSHDLTAYEIDESE
jgi:hypothetical protein